MILVLVDVSLELSLGRRVGFHLVDRHVRQKRAELTSRAV